jgi:hypothetical protein
MDIGAGAGDDAGLAIEFLFGHDLHLVEQAGAQGAKRDRLLRPDLLDHCRELAEIGNRQPPRRATRHHTSRTVALDAAIRRQGNAFGQRAVGLGEASQLRAHAAAPSNRPVSSQSKPE